MQVNIKCKQVIHYDQIVEMTKEHYEQLKDLDMEDISDREYEDEYYLLQRYINTRDVIGFDDEYKDVQVIKEKVKK